LTSARRRLSSASPHRPQVQNTKLRDEEIMETSRCMYERVGWNRSIHKTFDKIQDFTAWGTSVNSASGKVGAPLPRRQTIIELTLGLLNLDYVTQKTMQQALSLYTHPFMHRRLLFSCFGEAFTWTSKFQPRQLKRLNRSVVDELIFAVLLLPLAESCIRWPISTEVCASDATPVRGGLAKCQSTESIVESIYRFCEFRGEHVRLDWNHRPGSLTSSMTTCGNDIEELMYSHVWQAWSSFKHPRRAHVN